MEAATQRDDETEEDDGYVQEEDEDVEEHVDRFFAELDIDQERQKRRLLKADGAKVSLHTL